MRTNRTGNLKRFFCIENTETVLDLCCALPCDGQVYDYIFWNPSDVLRAEGEQPGQEQVSAGRLFELLSETGKLVIYFDNPMGLHAFATGNVCETCGIGYSFLKDQVEELTAYVKWYYPYPSVEFPSVFFSDERLPGKNECDDNVYHFDKARIEAFDEQKVTDRVVKAGMYPYLAQSYMVIVSKKPFDGYPIYTRFSNERRTDTQIRTDLCKDSVKKCALTQEAKQHVLRMQKVEPELRDILKEMTVFGKECDVNAVVRCDEQEGSLSFDYVSGRSLEQILDDLLAEGKAQEVAQELLAYCRQLGNHKELRPFEMTDEFVNVFGEFAQECRENGEWKTLPVSNIDLVCQNLLIDEKAVVIDYEWTYEFPVPVEFLMFRFLYFYLEAKHRTCMQQSVFCDIYEKAGITEEMREVFLQMETNFQRYVQQGAEVLCNSYDERGKAVLTRAQLDKQLEKLDSRGAKVSGDGTGIYQIPDASEGTKLRLDGYAPGAGCEDEAESSKTVILRIGAMADMDGKHVGLTFETNGYPLGGLLYLFENVIPEITLGGIAAAEADAKNATGAEDEAAGEKMTGAQISVEEIEMSEAAKRELTTTIADMRFIIDNREQQIAELKNSASWKVTKPLRMLKGNKEE